MTGSLQQKNGKYYAVINLTDINGKRKQKWISTGFEIKGNKKNAEKFLRDKINEFETQQFTLKRSDILFCDYVNIWLENKKIGIDAVTYQGYKTIVNAHISPYFADKEIKLCDLTRKDLQTYISDKLKYGRSDGTGGLSAKTVKSHIVVIRQVLKEALKNELIAVNPSEFIELPKIQKYEADYYTVEEIQHLFEAIKQEELFPLIYLTVIYGLRRSEVLGLKWDSFADDKVTIKHTVVRFTETVEKDTTKTASSHRTYPLTEDIKLIVSELKESENENRNLFGKQYIENDYIFKRANGEPYTTNYITQKFKSLLKKYNLRPIRFHDLRHSCASLLVANGFEMKDIQEWLGHSDFSTTANIYSHLDIKRKNNIADAMSKSLSI